MTESFCISEQCNLPLSTVKLNMRINNYHEQSAPLRTSKQISYASHAYA